MNQTQTLTAAPETAVSMQDTWTLSDCHEAEHLLIGTHDLTGTQLPVCVTCQIDRGRRR